MEKNATVTEVIAGMILAFALFLVGVFFILTGLSFLPIVGIFVGIAIIGLSHRFFSHVMAAAKERKVVTCSDTHASCHWPPVSNADQLVSGC